MFWSLEIPFKTGFTVHQIQSAEVFSSQKNSSSVNKALDMADSSRMFIKSLAYSSFCLQYLYLFRVYVNAVMNTVFDVPKT